MNFDERDAENKKLVLALMEYEGCNSLCKHGYVVNTYQLCDMACNDKNCFELDTSKLEKEFGYIWEYSK